jgi:hypothetical protein
MDFFFLAIIAAIVAWQYKRREQALRIALLGRHLGRYQIEKHMEALTQGYMRALDEADPERAQQVWNLLRPTEQELCTQCTQLVADFAAAPAEDTRVSTVPFYLPLATRLLAEASFDMRRALALHAQGICRAVQREDGAPKARAFVILAELLLMQHTCHWFCRSRTVASARLLARHKTSYEQLVAAVAPETRAAYATLVGRPQPRE